MAFTDTTWYTNFGDGSTTGYYAVTVWPSLTAVAAGVLRRQAAAPAVGSERVFVCIVAGTTLVSEPTWTTTRGAKTAEAAGPTWQECTGASAVNGDLTNTPNWTTVKNTAVTLGQIIKRNNAASYQICSTAGTAGNGAEPSFSDTAGTTTVDNTITWTSLGAVGNFTGWQAPHARLANAFTATWGAVGNQFFVASEHAETQASVMTLTSPGTLASPCFVYCVTKTTVPPVSANLTTGATVSTTGANSLAFGSQACYWKNLTFKAGDSSNAASVVIANASTYYGNFDACGFTLNNTNAASVFNLGNVGGGLAQKVYLNNCTLTFGSNTGQKISCSSADIQFVMRGGSFAVGANVPTVLFNTIPAYLFLEGVDLSGFGSGKTLLNASTTSLMAYLKDCKLGASVTVAATPTSSQQEIFLFRSDSSGTNYRSEKYTYTGTQTIETTIVRTGGASDGTTTVAWKIVTTANSKWVLPFECIPITIWNDTSGSSVTVTVYGIWGGGAVPNNDEIWMDVEYLGSSATPQGSFATTTKADNLASGSAVTSDASTWGGSTTAFKMVATFTPQMKGPFTVYVKAAKVSNTFYIDPKVSVT